MKEKVLKFGADDVPGVKTPTGTTVKMLIHPESTGKPVTIPLSILLVILPPGTETDEHVHEDSDEYEYFATGKGMLYRNGKEVGIVGPNTIVYNPKGALHKVKNVGSEEIYLLRVHIPPLPHAGLIGKAIDLAKDFFKKQ
jgi:quercetin dioxygenase-like cupin family protein